MRRFTWVDKKGRRARRSEGRGDFLTDMPTLADAGDNHTPTRARDRRNCGGKNRLHLTFEHLGQSFQPPHLDRDSSQRTRERLMRLGGSTSNGVRSVSIPDAFARGSAASCGR